MNINQHFLNAWKIKKLIHVPIVNDEYLELMKATPVPQKCHQNVANMQMKYGGKTVLGFGFYQIGLNDDIIVEPHSVWKRTDESDESYVDVSLGYTNDNDTMLNPIGDNPPKSILFAPLKHFDSSKEFYDIYESYHLYKKEFVRKTPLLTTGKYSFFKDKDLTELIFHRNKSVLESENWKEFLEERESA